MATEDPRSRPPGLGSFGDRALAVGPAKVAMIAFQFVSRQAAPTGGGEVRFLHRPGAKMVRSETCARRRRRREDPLLYAAVPLRTRMPGAAIGLRATAVAAD